ncbi:MAG: cbb3-type cytochrome c oxidase subunit 3 [Alphaproteobacteria bacterium]|nr:cbb3-type cytochrome c oxidase subunit 3 [Alphaproteobacteria bacterium]
METYTILRQFADSWGLLAMFLFFGAVILHTFRPGSGAKSKDIAQIPLRHVDHPDDVENSPEPKTSKNEAGS